MVEIHMDESNPKSGAEANRVVKRGETYEHSEYGPVEVEGIWRGVDKVDSAHNAAESDTIIVRYSGDSDHVDSLIDTLDEFFAAIEDSDRTE